jgi:hypothetical protein
MPDFVKHPQNEFTWEDRPTKLAKIKVGDKLWVGEGQYPCSKGIKEVTRITNTLIIVGKGNQRWERFRKVNGYQIAGAWLSHYISGVATEAEVEEYNAEQVRKKTEEERKQNEQKAIENMQNELNALFPENGPIYVRQEYHPAGFSVTVSGLTAEQIRKAAPNLREILGL